MGVFSIIGLCLEVIKLIYTAYKLIKQIKTDNPDFVTAPFIKKLKEAISHYRLSGSKEAFGDLQRELVGIHEMRNIKENSCL